MDHLFSDIEKAAMILRGIITEAPKILESNTEEIKLLEQEIMDIEHVLELKPFNASKGYSYARQISEARKRRRVLKDQIEQIRPLVEVLRRPKITEHELNKAIGEIRRVKRLHEGRTYRMRVRGDLQDELVPAGSN
jgi:prefoldin subunit 5